VFWKFYARELKLTRSHFEDLESMDDVSFRPRLCKKVGTVLKSALLRKIWQSLVN
jgi:hypothetical protein